MVVKGERKSMRTKWKEEKARMQGMTRKEKLDHLWTYYKEFLWIAGVVLLLLVGFISSGINMLFRENVITGMMVNISFDQRGYNYLESGYHEKIGAREYWDKVKLEYMAFDPVQELAGDEQSYYASMAVINEVSAKILDYMILDKPAMEYYITQDVYMDLREFFTQEELAQFAAEDRLIYAQEEGSEDKWVIAVEITQIPFIQDNLQSDSRVYFALAGNTEKLDTCRDMWQHILDWPGHGK